MRWPAESSVQALLQPATILCVDDEPSPLLLRAMVLRRFGFEVVQTTSAADALEILDQRPIDLVLTDLLMPTIDGGELARLIKQKRPQMPVAIISGVNDVPAEASATDAFIGKLDGHEAMRDRLLELLKKSSSARR